MTSLAAFIGVAAQLALFFCIGVAMRAYLGTVAFDKQMTKRRYIQLVIGVLCVSAVELALVLLLLRK